MVCDSRRSLALQSLRSSVLLGILFASLNLGLGAAESQGGITEQPFAPHSGPRGKTMFTVLLASDTGIVTENKYADPIDFKNGYKDPRMFGDRYHEFEVGAVGTGVTIGDYDGDGRPDLFIVSKTESCRLFRNLGGWKFEDVTEKAGVGDKGEAAAAWKQGATFVDVNNDGLLDIYVCRFNAPNLLYINQGDGTFKEGAAARGLAVVDSSVMAAFCDYDRDGWLDVYVQTNLLDFSKHPNGQKDYLFHNKGDGTFTNVTERAGIGGETQGHSVTWWDYDNDAWPDIYVANDFATPDFLYHNNRDGSFTNLINSVLPHMPLSSMGSDLGDVNNDGLIDFFATEMAATTHQKDQRTMAVLREQIQDLPDGSPLAPQYMRNALYLNTGTGHFLEASFLSGLAATDWTWSVRFEDMDNDGGLDLFVPNGMHREVHNADMIQRLMLAETPAEKVRIEKASSVLIEANLAFRNLGDLRFENVSAAWGLDEKGASFGSAFGDLDGDGDLDLVYSNYRKGATVLRNDSDTGHRVAFALRGTQSNRFGVGATVRIETARGRQVRQLVLARGVLSSSEPILHFGLGNETQLKRVTVSWPSGQTQVFTDLGVDRKFTITEPSTPVAKLPAEAKPATPTQFSEVSQAANISMLSREMPVDETAQQPLLPMRQNRRGPSLAVGDVNGGGKDDIVLGGTSRDPVRLLLNSGSAFAPGDATGLSKEDSLNDGPVLLFDADGDGSNDLLITRSGIALPAGSPDYQPRLFLNQGRGTFRAAPVEALPSFPVSVGAVAAADFDHSGKLSLFLGGRVVPGQYPQSPRSALWANRGGRFEDVTDRLAPGLANVGMVSSALWSDVDGDAWSDLLLTLEWGQVKYFHNNQGKGFEDWTEKSGFSSAGTGWWNSIASADFNSDGRPDFVLGNLGLNTQYRADPAHPALLFVGDFKGDGGEQLIEAYYEGDKLYPWRTRRTLGESIPSILKRYLKNDLYARATLGEILREEKLKEAQRFAATEFRSGVLLSQPDGSYRFEALPQITQISPIQGLVAGDFDGDGFADIYAVQNSYAPIPSVGRFDGGLSQLLTGDGHGHFAPILPASSGLVVPGDAKALAVLDLDGDGWPDFLVSRNDNTTLAFRNSPLQGRHSYCIKLRGAPGNPSAVGARITVELSDGSRQSAEVHAGSGYYSQSAPACFFGANVGKLAKKILIQWPSGLRTETAFPEGGQVLTIECPK